MKSKIFEIVLILILLLIATPLYAQSQSDVEEATRAAGRLPEKEKIEEELKKPPEEPAEVKPEEALPQKEEKKFFVKEIKLVGCESFSPEDFSSIAGKYENKELALSGLEALSKELEREYLRRGVIAAVFVPPQDIEDGIATLRVIEAKMGELQIQEHKHFKKERLNYYWRVPPGEILRYDRISKSVQMMNKNPDREVKAALHAGKKPGTTDILLTPKTRYPMHLTSTVDKEGVVSTGMSRMGLGVRHNNLLGLDDMLITGHTFGKAFGGSYVYHVLPVSSNGTSLLYGYSRSRATPRKEFETTGLISRAESVSFSVRQDLYKKDAYLGEVFAGFDAKDKTIKLDTGVNNRDRLRVVSLGGNFVQRGLGKATYYSPEYSQGVGAFGASSTGNPLASRGARPIFSKFNLGVQHKESLPFELQANLKFKSQITSTDLTPQEQFSLGGIDSVRGYPAGDFLADNGFSDTAELLFPSLYIPKKWRLPYAEASLREQTTSLVFLDHGWGWRKGSSSIEKESANFFSLGAGLRMRLYNQAFLRFEWGFPLHDDPITETGDSRFHFSIDFEDKFPEEVERIRKLRQEKKGEKKALPALEYELVEEILTDQEKEAMAIVHFEAGNILYREGNLEEAKAEWGKAMKITTDPRMVGYIHEAEGIARENSGNSKKEENK